MFVLDTNVVSELRKVRTGKANRRVAQWADSMDVPICLFPLLRYRSWKLACCWPNAKTHHRVQCFARG